MTAVNKRKIESPADIASCDDLPEGWALAQARDLLNLVNGFAFRPSHWKGSGLPIIRIQNLNNPEASFNHCPDQIPEKYVVKNGDLLFAWSGTPGTSFGAHIWQGGDAWLNQHIFRVEFNKEFLDKRFVRLAINHNLDEYIAQAQGGVGLAHITKKKFEVSFLQIPPLAEQKRIVAKVEQLLSRVNAAKERLAKASKILKRFRYAVLAAACSGCLTSDWREENPDVEPASILLKEIRGTRKNQKAKLRTKKKVPPIDTSNLPQLPAKWEWAMVGEISSKIHYGYTASSERDPIGPKLLRITDIQNDAVSWNTVPYCKIDENQRKKYLLKEGDLVFARTGATVGKSYLLSGVFPESVFASYLIRIIINERVSKKFVYYFFKSLSYWQQITLSHVGIGQPNVSAQILSTIILPLPPLLEQQEIVRRIKALFKLADAIEQQVAAAAAQVEKLTHAILAKAFRGELVPTEAELAQREGRFYEPAHALLAKIKVQRKDVKAQQKHRRSRRGRNKSAILATWEI